VAMPLAVVFVAASTTSTTSVVTAGPNTTTP
jgi:hypothetical protein